MNQTDMPVTPLVPTGPRARVRQGVQPIARALGRLGLTPNALTLIGFAIAVVAAYFAATQAWLYAGVLVIFGAVFDLFDGALARATNQTSKFGAFLDSTMDRWGEAVVYVGLVVGLLEVGFTIGSQLAAAAMASAFMVSYVRAKSESLGFTPGTGMASVGLAPREVRIVILTLGLIGAGVLYSPTDALRYQPLWYLVLVGSLALITILATLTTIQRIFHVYREAKKQEQQ
jgi:phosphatidylglycerophosphate synthase